MDKNPHNSVPHGTLCSIGLINGLWIDGFWKQFLPPSSELRQFDRINYRNATKLYYWSKYVIWSCSRTWGSCGEWGSSRKWILCKSKEVRIHHWPNSLGSTMEKRQQFPSQGTNSLFQGIAAVWAASLRPGDQGQEDSKTLNTYLNSSLKILAPPLDRKSLTFFLPVGVDEPI